jgi:formylglycine-generating enzyme required for sulfatase activity
MAQRKQVSVEPTTIISALVAGIAKNLLNSYVKDGIAKDVLGELSPQLDPSRFLRGKSDDGDAGLIDKTSKDIVREMKPLFDGAGDVNAEAVALAAATGVSRAHITAKTVVVKDLDPRAIADAILDASRTERVWFSDDEKDLLRKLVDRLSVRIADAAHLLSGWNVVFPRAVLDRLTTALAEIATLRGERGNDQELFEREYQSAVRGELDRLDYIGLREIDDRHRTQSLEVSYISLDVETHDGGSAVVNTEEILTRSRRLVICGEAGAGKTTLLQWIAVQAASPESQRRPGNWTGVFPFFLRLRQLAGDFPAAVDFPGHTVRNAGVPAIPGWAVRLLRSGHALVLVDGMDEVSESDRPKVLEGLEDLVMQFPLARFVVSSRSHAVSEKSWPAWSRWIASEGFTRVTLRPMGQRQVGEFIALWHKAARECYTDTHDDAKWDDLPRQLLDLLGLPDQKSLQELAATPLLCAMICALHVEYGKNMPRSRTSLYGKCLEMLLLDRDSKRRVPATADYPAPEMKKRQALAQELAYHMMEIGALDMAEGDVDDFFTKVIADGTRNDMTGPGIRSLLADRCSLLGQPVEGRLAFRHKTFQEFLAAEYAVLKHAIASLAANSAHTEWRETVILAASLFHRDECGKLLLSMTRKSRKGMRHFTTALGCLESDNVPVEVRQKVVEACSEKLFPPTLETAKYVAAAGDPAVPLLEAAEGMDPATRAACVHALGHIGTSTALAAIERHATATEFLNCWSTDAEWGVFVRELGVTAERFDFASYAPRVFKQSRWGDSGIAVAEPNAPSPVPWALVAYLIGDGTSPPPVGDSPRWWALWLAASTLCDEQGRPIPTVPDLPEELCNNVRMALTALAKTPAALLPPERALCGRVLSVLGDERPGVGLRPDGLPDIAWCTVEAGEFLLGSDPNRDVLASDDERPQRTAYLPAFRIGKYPVTNKQFQAFVHAGDGYRQERWWKGLHEDALEQWNEGANEPYVPFDNHPRESVSWFEAMAFCKWLSFRLGYEVKVPTEEEWEKAARGADGRIYPYEGEYNPAKSNVYDGGIGQTSAVGAFPDGASPCGALDMSGNVFEWTRTEYDTRNSGDDASAAARVLRGGSFFGNDDLSRAAYRYLDEPYSRSNYVGFRLASLAIPESLNTDTTGC